MKGLKRIAWGVAAGLLLTAGTAAATIYCPAGFYCNDEYDACIAAGELTPYGCWLLRERCYQDACQ